LYVEIALYLTITTIKRICPSLNFIEQSSSPFMFVHFVLIKSKVASTVHSDYNNSEDSTFLVRISSYLENWAVILPSLFSVTALLTSVLSRVRSRRQNWNEPYPKLSVQSHYKGKLTLSSAKFPFYRDESNKHKVQVRKSNTTSI